MMKITLATSIIVALAVPATSRLAAVNNNFDAQVKELLAASQVPEQVLAEESVDHTYGDDLFGSETQTYSPAAMQSELESHREVWRSYVGEATNYDMTFERVCYCLDSWRGPYRMQIRDGKVQSAAYTRDSSAVEPDIMSSLLTVDGVFGQIQFGISGKYYDLQVTYNETAGYPSSFYSDQSSMIADDEMTYKISDVALATGR